MRINLVQCSRVIQQMEDSVGITITQQLQQALKQDDQAIAGIIAKMLPFIQSQASQVICPGLEFDDAVQEGIIAVFRGLQGYNQQKGATFETYIRHCIINAIRDAVKAAGRKKHSPLNYSIPLDQETALTAGPEEIAIQNEQFHLTMNKVYTHLSFLEKQVFLLFLDGYSYGEIAQRLNISTKNVNNAMVRIRKKLKTEDSFR